MKDYILGHIQAVGVYLVFAAIVASWFGFKRLPSWIRAVRAGTWPMAQGRIETVAVRAIGDQALGELGYSYLVGRTRYSGYYSQQFTDEQLAWDYVTRLQAQSVVVRYRQGNPDVSALRIGDQQSYVSLRADSFLTNLVIALFNRVRQPL
jgi:hypothetical protein